MKNCFCPVLWSFFAGVSCHRMWPSSIYYFLFLFIRIKSFLFNMLVVVTNENMIEILFSFSYLTPGWQPVTGNDKILHLINSFQTDIFTEAFSRPYYLYVDDRMMGVSGRGPPDTLTPLFLHLLQPLGLQQPTKYCNIVK